MKITEENLGHWSLFPPDNCIEVEKSGLTGEELTVFLQRFLKQPQRSLQPKHKALP